MPRAPGPDLTEGSMGLCQAHDEAPQAEPRERLRQTHVGLGAGGLDTQDIRKSFFLLAFPERKGQGS